MARPDDHGDDDHDHSHLDAMELRVRALETILSQKGLIDPAALDVLIDTYQSRIGPRNGARVAARAWVDPEFAAWLRRDARTAAASLVAAKSATGAIGIERCRDAWESAADRTGQPIGLRPNYFAA